MQATSNNPYLQTGQQHPAPPSVVVSSHEIAPERPTLLPTTLENGGISIHYYCAPLTSQILVNLISDTTEQINKHFITTNHPLELYLKIFKHLDPAQAICRRLTNKASRTHFKIIFPSIQVNFLSKYATRDSACRPLKALPCKFQPWVAPILLVNFHSYNPNPPSLSIQSSDSMS